MVFEKVGVDEKEIFVRGDLFFERTGTISDRVVQFENVKRFLSRKEFPYAIL